jgi:hypothetical protein
MRAARRVSPGRSDATGSERRQRRFPAVILTVPFCRIPGALPFRSSGPTAVRREELAATRPRSQGPFGGVATKPGKRRRGGQGPAGGGVAGKAVWQPNPDKARQGRTRLWQGNQAAHGTRGQGPAARATPRRVHWAGNQGSVRRGTARRGRARPFPPGKDWGKRKGTAKISGGNLGCPLLRYPSRTGVCG